MKLDGAALKIAVVGLGQAGGNIAAEFFRRGYQALALNTSNADLQLLEAGAPFPYLPESHHVHIGPEGWDGTGNDPGVARECIDSHEERILRAVMPLAEESDVVILAAGLGGGTGSAIVHLARLLQAQELPLVALVTLPTQAESAIAKVNAAKALREVSDFDFDGLILVDNARLVEFNAELPIAQYYAKVNEVIVEPIDTLNRLNTRDDLQPIRSFDGEELREALHGGGVVSYGVAPLKDTSLDGVSTAVKACFQASRIMPHGFSIADISFLALVLEAPDDILEATPIRVLEQLQELWKADTEGAAVALALYRQREAGEPRLRLLATHHSLPDQVNKLIGEASTEGRAVIAKRRKLPELELGDLDTLDIAPSGSRTSKRRRTKRAPQPATPNVQAKKPSPRPKSVPIPSTEPLPEEVTTQRREPSEEATSIRDAGGQSSAATDIVKSEDELLLPGAPPPPKGPEGAQNVPAQNIYQALFYRYQTADSAAMQKKIVRRLEKDRESEYALVRYYAVQTMGRLDVAQFEASILAATEDEDPQVRALAEWLLKGQR